MLRKRSWTKEQLEEAVIKSRSFRQVINDLGLIPAGGNYSQIKKYISEYRLSTRHFLGRGWNKGLIFNPNPERPIEELLVRGRICQSHKLRQRLIKVGIKNPWCEKCHWAKKTDSGYLPLELDHINGDSSDNRINNLQILCPNCHSLQLTHRGKNIKKRK